MNFPDFLSNRRKTETVLDRPTAQNSKSQSKLAFKPGLFNKTKGSQPAIKIYKESQLLTSDFKSPKTFIRKTTKSKEGSQIRNVYNKGSFVNTSKFFKKQKSQSKLPLEIFDDPKATIARLQDLCTYNQKSKKSKSKTKTSCTNKVIDNCINKKKKSQNVLRGKFFSTVNNDSSKNDPVIKPKRLIIDGSPKTNECTKTLSFTKKKASTLNVNSIAENNNTKTKVTDKDLVNPLLRSKLKNLELRILNAINSQKSVSNKLN